MMEASVHFECEEMTPPTEEALTAAGSKLAAGYSPPATQAVVVKAGRKDQQGNSKKTPGKKSAGAGGGGATGGDSWLVDAHYDEAAAGQTIAVAQHVFEDACPCIFPYQGFRQFLKECWVREVEAPPVPEHDPNAWQYQALGAAAPIAPAAATAIAPPTHSSTAATLALEQDLAARDYSAALAAIVRAEPASREAKMNEYRDAMSARVRIGDNIAVECSDEWEGHKWYCAKVVKALYTVEAKFMRGDVEFEVGDRVMDVFWYDPDADARPAGDTQFFLLAAVDTVFSFSTVEIKIPMQEQILEAKDGEPVVPTYLLKKSDAGHIDKSVDDQENAVEGKA